MAVQPTELSTLLVRAVLRGSGFWAVGHLQCCSVALAWLRPWCELRPGCQRRWSARLSTQGWADLGASRQRETVPFSGFWVWAPALEELGGPGLPPHCVLHCRAEGMGWAGLSGGTPSTGQQKQCGLRACVGLLDGSAPSCHRGALVAQWGCSGDTWRGRTVGEGLGSSHGFCTSAGKQASHCVIWCALKGFLPLGLLHITTQRHADLGGVMLALYPLTLL